MFGGGGIGPSDEAEFLVGEAANLEPLRAALSTNHEETIASALQQILRQNNNNEAESPETSSSSEERVLVPLTTCRVTLQSADGDGDDGMQDDSGVINENSGTETSDHQGGEEKEDDKNNQHFKNILGKIVVTSERVLFVAAAAAAAAVTAAAVTAAASVTTHQDLSIDAECIQLHAQSTDPISVYLQMEGSDEDDSPTEVVIVPEISGDINNNTDNSAETICEELFSKLTELISLHPVSPNDSDGGGGMMGMMSMMGLMNGSSGVVNGMNGFITSESIMTSTPGAVTGTGGDDDNDDMIFAEASTHAATLQNDPHQFSDCEEDSGGDDGQGATSEEREAMLERLDSLLVVKPELEIKDGDQFADADEPEEGGSEQNDNTGESSKIKAVPVGQFDDADGDDAEDPLL